MLVATRYAKSLLQLATEKGQLEKVYADMQLVENVCEHNREFTNFLNSPIIKTDKKVAVVKEIFGSKVNEVTLGFLSILTQKRRESYMKHIATEFIAQYKQHKNTLTAVITSAVGIDGTVKAKVLELVKQTTKGEVELVEKTDKSLIGGFVLTIGDKQVDASVSRQLNDLRKTFSGSTFNN
ncbi:MAG TPA: ATP synthase F1 subunit delta [Bacteroidia bacterium]|nr:ATP synthase F1 subunit delta [Bacteroidia bacterium]